jgi:protein-S-isoprenylcysteine O-methyltransferase Ste14
VSRTAKFFLLGIAPVLAILLVLLGFATQRTNPLGWFLVLTGVAYPAGVVMVYIIRRKHFWESSLGGAITQEERGDRSYWLITTGMMVAFYLPPVDYLYFAAIIPRIDWSKASGIGLVLLGTGLFVWARQVLHTNYSGHVSVKSGQTLTQSGPYRVIRHPAYAGYLLMALGISLGYSSLAGLCAVLLLLIPGMVYRIRVEENFLEAHFGDGFHQYASRTKRLIPGIW